MTTDYIGLAQVPVSVSPKTPAIRKKVLARLDVMQRELAYVQSAMSRLRAALNGPDPSSKPIADAVMDSRNWTLSVAMSHAYVHSMLSTFEFDGPVAVMDLPHLHTTRTTCPSCSFAPSSWKRRRCTLTLTTTGTCGSSLTALA
jgi:hypothetical protein